MYTGAIVLEGEQAELESYLDSIGTPRAALNPRRVLAPPSAQEIRKTYQEQNEGPCNLRDWKRHNWGTEKIDSSSVVWEGEERAQILFSCQEIPRPLLQQMLQSPLVQGVLVYGKKGVLFRGQSAADSIGGLLARHAELQRLGLLDIIQARLRTSAVVSDLAGLAAGRMVRIEVAGKLMTIQRDLLGNSRADLIIDDTSPLDDVLPAWHGDLCLWLDLEK